MGCLMRENDAMPDGKVKGTNMYADYTAREKILVDGVGDWVQLLAVHWHVEQESPDTSLPEVQEKTIDMIRSLVREGLFELGTVPSDAIGFVPSSDLEGTIQEIRRDYIGQFEDRDWEYHWWLNLTPKGEQLAEPLIDAYRRELGVN